MRWSYKTMHFGLKKDGLLGGAFLDDAEIEETLNEYGQGGWELVSMFETRDGVLAVFKQPLEYPPMRQAAAYARRNEGGRPGVAVAAVKPHYEEEDESVNEPVRETGYRDEPEEDNQYPALDKERPDPRVAETDEDEEEDDSDSGIGSIRIE